MTRRARIKTPRTETFPLELEPLTADAGWFVYLFALADCSAFKVGFSCNPLQRIYTFSPRFFERFDLAQSMLFAVVDCDASRAVEADLKMLLAAQRIAAPEWVPTEAGGHTEWFSAVYFSDAYSRLRELAGDDSSRFSSAFDTFGGQLARAREAFELWAIQQAQRAVEVQEFGLRGYAVRDRSFALRDWLLAYRYFDIPIFINDSELLRSIQQCAGLIKTTESQRS